MTVDRVVIPAAPTKGARDLPPLGLTILGLALVSLSSRAPLASVPPILHELGIGAVAQSVVVALPVLCFSVGALMGPPLRRRLGDERAILVAVVGLLGGVTARAAWPEWALFPGTVVAGLATALLSVLLPTLVKRRFPRRVGAITALYTTLMSVGTALAAGLSVPVLTLTASVRAALGV